MAVTKVALTKEDIILIKTRLKSINKIRFLGSVFSLLVLLIVYLSVGCDSSNSTFYDFRIFIIVINAFLFISSIRDVTYYNDLKEKTKICRNCQGEEKRILL